MTTRDEHIAAILAQLPAPPVNDGVALHDWVMRFGQLAPQPHASARQELAAIVSGKLRARCGRIDTGVAWRAYALIMAVIVEADMGMWLGSSPQLDVVALSKDAGVHDLIWPWLEFESSQKITDETCAELLTAYKVAEALKE